MVHVAQSIDGTVAPYLHIFQGSAGLRCKLLVMLQRVKLQTQVDTL
jgi:hypothetical protein